MVDRNSKAEHSSVRSVVLGKDNYSMSIFPNPAKNKATLMLDAKDGEELFVKVFDGSGRMVKKQIVIVRNQQSELKLESLQTGMYGVIAVNSNGEHFKTKLMVIR